MAVLSLAPSWKAKQENSAKSSKTNTSAPKDRHSLHAYSPLACCFGKDCACWLLGDSGKLYRLFPCWNIFWYTHKYEQTTIPVKRKLLPAASPAARLQLHWNKQQCLNILTPKPSLDVGASLDPASALPLKSDLIPITSMDHIRSALCISNPGTPFL